MLPPIVVIGLLVPSDHFGFVFAFNCEAYCEGLGVTSPNVFDQPDKENERDDLMFLDTL